MEQLWKSCRDDTFKLLLERSELIGEIKRGPLLVSLVEVWLIFSWNLIDMVDSV